MTLFDQWCNEERISVDNETYLVAQKAWNAALEAACNETTSSRIQAAIRMLKTKDKE